MSQKVRDIFGRWIRAGDIIAYASSKGFFVAVVREVIKNRKGDDRKVRLLYPSLYHEEVRVKSTSHYVGEHDYLRIAPQQIESFIGHEVSHGGDMDRWRKELLSLREKVFLELRTSKTEQHPEG